MPIKQGPGKIDWCDYTRNFVLGLCAYNCPYCYMKYIFKRFKLDPTLRINEREMALKPRKKGQKYFVCSNLDLFHPDIPGSWINRVVNKTWEDPDNIYEFLTKNPEEYKGFEFPDNAWLGTTVDGRITQLGNFVSISEVAIDSEDYGRDGVHFISFEPLLAFWAHWIQCYPNVWDTIDWIIIGADSRRGAEKPPDEWADRLIEMARKHDVAVWVKDNYKYHDRIKEFPNV